MYIPLFVGDLCLSLLCYASLCVHSSIVIILKKKRKLVALQFLSYRYIFTINVLWLFITMPWVDLQCVIVVFPDHTHFLCLSVCLNVSCHVGSDPLSTAYSQKISGIPGITQINILNFSTPPTILILYIEIKERHQKA